ncbi:MAG: H(+)-transporting ATP synthase vacuolar type subunit D [Erysipelotrichaceae bacterium]|nr:MAG: H(+)-transporting ATP synthase vacuolar type subunit [Erysipelotrichaceae bacterium]TXT19999.1 MAG: H(+)-transporting ATP synthase vacuolar type subunit D [Erysipelotrichaceae bacterium]
MAKLSVNPTRMQLRILKKKLIVAMRGHKLLKDKRDELMRQFLILVRENNVLRQEVENGIRLANASMAIAGNVMQKQVLDVALMLPKQELQIEMEEKNVMSVLIPSYTIKLKTNNTNDIYSYGYAFTSSELDDAIKALSDVFPQMLRLAEVEKSCQLIAAEIEKTRRRVNALEHVIIPQYQETIKYIKMKLDENERGTITRLMKVKDMILAQAHGYNQ